MSLIRLTNGISARALQRLSRFSHLRPALACYRTRPVLHPILAMFLEHLLTRRDGHDGTVSDFLVTYLESIDERLLEYLDEDDEMKLDAVQHLRFNTSALLDGSITPDHVMEDWADWYHLVPAFVATYASTQLQELQVAAWLLEVTEKDEEVISTRPAATTSRHWRHGSPCTPRCEPPSSQNSAHPGSRRQALQTTKGP